jgi:hypothetical protein
MLVSNSAVQGSTWGWTNKSLGTTGIANSDINYGEFVGLTVANDGYAYAVPVNSSTGIPLVNSVMVVSPGKSNSRYENYTAPTGSLVAATGSAGKPNFIAGMNMLLNKGILAPNGKIYYVYVDSVTKITGLCILTPNSGDCTWEFYNIVNTQAGTSTGCILGKDGKLYIIPNGGSYSLIRLDISGSSPVEEVSGWYDGSVATGSLIVTRNSVTSLGSVLQLQLTDTVTNIAIGNQVVLSGTTSDTQGVLSTQADTIVTGINATTKQITVYPAPEVPINNASVVFRPFSKRVYGSSSLNPATSIYFSKFVGFFEKAFSVGDWASATPDAAYNPRRNPQSNTQGASVASGNITSYTAFLDNLSNKIYILPGGGTQIFYIDPDEWNTRFAFHTAPGLSLNNLQIGNVGTVPSYGRATVYVGNKFKKYSAPKIGPDNNFYIPISIFASASTNYLPASVQKILKINTSTNEVSFLPDPDAVPAADYGTITGASALNLLPNGELFTFSVLTIGLDTAYNNYMEIYSDGSQIKKVSSANAYGKGYFYKRGAYQDLVVGKPEGSLNSPSSQFGGVTFGTTASKNGKVIMSANRLLYGLEYLSVKGFYTDVTKFNLLSSDINDIPSNLADLPTSNYNIYRNTLG